MIFVIINQAFININIIKILIMNIISARVLLCLFFALLFLNGCNKEKDPGPDVSIGDASQARLTTGTIMTVNLYLDKPSKDTVKVVYTLVDGTAKAPEDYEAASASIAVPPNQTKVAFAVQIKGDPTGLREPNLQFTIRLSDPKNCTIGTSTATGTIITENGTYLPTDNTGYTTPLAYSGYTLLWSDEFSGYALDTHVWNQEQGTGSNGWGNNELEYYTRSPRNTFVSGGNLIIEAREEDLGSSKYTSGRMTTQDKKVFRFGRIDIRAKLPVGKGIWPALWMLGTNIATEGWPACGEIDIMELIGKEPSVVYGTLHWGTSGSHQSKGSSLALPSGDFSDEFHVFSIIWQQDSISWYINDELFLETNKSDVGGYNYPFNSDQFFIFNVAVGGNWPGSPDNTTAFPERMFVDYVRVFQQNTSK